MLNFSKRCCFGVVLILMSVLLSGLYGADPELEEEELRAIGFLQYIDEEVRKITKETLLAVFEYDTNMTKINRKAMNAAIIEGVKRTKEITTEGGVFRWRNYKDPNARRQFWLRSTLGVHALPEMKYKRWSKIGREMREALAATVICAFDDPKLCNSTFRPEVAKILATSRNPTELQYIYKEYASAAGQRLKPQYGDYVDLLNEAAMLDGFRDASAAWEARYEQPDIRERLADLYHDLRPLYTLLHAFVRHRLRGKYGEVVSKNGPIPVHLTGDFNGATFKHLDDLLLDNVTGVNFTESLSDIDEVKVVKMAEEFYTAINFTSLPATFWNHSVFTKRDDANMLCLPKSYDIAEDDVRLKTCIDLTVEGVAEAHRQLANVMYFQAFSKHLPQIYRNEANEGFYEAVGESIKLSFLSLPHLKSLNFTSGENLPEEDVSHLLVQALRTLPPLAYAYAVDRWRWQVYNGNITSADYNCPWWRLVEEVQGLEPPADRSGDDFDVAVDPMLITHIPYMKSFVGKLLGYQFFKTLCLRSENYTTALPPLPLHKCDIYESTSSGNALKEMMSLGASRPWQETLKSFTGRKFIDTAPILEYYRPLQLWLEDEIDRLNIPMGWIKSTKVCHKENL